MFFIGKVMKSHNHLFGENEVRISDRLTDLCPRATRGSEIALLGREDLGDSINLGVSRFSENGMASRGATVTVHAMGGRFTSASAHRRRHTGFHPFYHCLVHFSGHLDKIDLSSWKHTVHERSFAEFSGSVSLSRQSSLTFNRNDFSAIESRSTRRYLRLYIWRENTGTRYRESFDLVGT